MLQQRPKNRFTAPTRLNALPRLKAALAFPNSLRRKSSKEVSSTTDLRAPKSLDELVRKLNSNDKSEFKSAFRQLIKCHSIDRFLLERLFKEQNVSKSSTVVFLNWSVIRFDLNRSLLSRLKTVSHATDMSEDSVLFFPLSKLLSEEPHPTFEPFSLGLNRANISKILKLEEELFPSLIGISLASHSNEHLKKTCELKTRKTMRHSNVAKTNSRHVLSKFETPPESKNSLSLNSLLIFGKKKRSKPKVNLSCSFSKSKNEYGINSSTNFFTLKNEWSQRNTDASLGTVSRKDSGSSVNVKRMRVLSDNSAEAIGKAKRRLFAEKKFSWQSVSCRKFSSGLN